MSKYRNKQQLLPYIYSMTALFRNAEKFKMFSYSPNTHTHTHIYLTKRIMWTTKWPLKWCITSYRPGSDERVCPPQMAAPSKTRYGSTSAHNTTAAPTDECNIGNETSVLPHKAIPIFPYNTVWDRWNKASTTKPSSIGPAVSIQHLLVTDGQKDSPHISGGRRWPSRRQPACL